MPLDQIAGNPDRIKVLADGLHLMGEDLRNAAADLDSALGAQITQWQVSGTATGLPGSVPGTGRRHWRPRAAGSSW